MNKCAECRNGEHEDFDNKIRLTIVRDPDTNKVYRRAYLCNEHREMYAMDGYNIYTYGGRKVLGVEKNEWKIKRKFTRRK